VDGHHLTRDQARRIAVGAQLLTAPRPTDLLAVVHRLTLLQIDPTAAVAPNADLVAWSRLGSSYRPTDLQRAVEHDRALVELDAFLRPVGDLPLLLAGARDRPSSEKGREWLRANETFRRDVVERLRAAGPLLSREIADTSAVPWPSTGWTNNRNVTQMLEILVMRGEVAIAGRRGRQRLWDAPERVYPPDLPVLPVAEAARIRDERRLRALGIARATGTALPGEPSTVGHAGEPATVDGVPGSWRVDPEALTRPFSGRTALLSPFDRLVHDRARALDLFAFDYSLEMYKPKAQRRWGYFALPVLHHDRLVGKVDATADHRRGRLRVDAIHQDVPFDAATTRGVHGELDDLASWLGLEIEGTGS